MSKFGHMYGLEAKPEMSLWQIYRKNIRKTYFHFIEHYMHIFVLNV